MICPECGTKDEISSIITYRSLHTYDLVLICRACGWETSSRRRRLVVTDACWKAEV